MVSVALSVNDVFNPGSFPEYTYVSRKPLNSSYTYEFRLKQALHTTGFLTSIIGPSKSGKTVLCEKVIGRDNMISLSGSDFRGASSFWSVVAHKIGFSIEQEQVQTNVVSAEQAAGVLESATASRREKFFNGKDQIIAIFKSHDWVLVLDDFHYAPEELQMDIAYQLKDAIRQGFQAVVVSLPHRADDAIRKNADLSGRLSLINIDPWRKEELTSIAESGFRALDISIAESLVETLALESLTSPQLMQSICLNLCLLKELDEYPAELVNFDEADLRVAFEATTLNLPYRDVYEKLRNGPFTRGQRRNKFQLSDGQELDLYGLLLKAIANDPPVTSISLTELKIRIDRLLDSVSSKPDRRRINDAFVQIQNIIASSPSIYQVLEWKEDVLYILEPLFLFYLRWGVA